MKKQAIIIDLDGTLCDTKHRQHFMTAEKKDWKSFYEALKDDTPNFWCQFLLDHLSEKICVLFVSGRPDEYREDTVSWLQSWSFDWHELFMRRSGDYRKDSIIKVEIYKEQIEPNYDVLFCIDDRQQVVDAWREIGLTCLQCAKGDF